MKLQTLKPRVAVLNPSSAKPLQAPSRYGEGRGGRPWRRLREQVLRRDGFQCQTCKALGLIVPADVCDHIVPKAEGGGDDPTNLQALCKQCSNRKSAEEAKRGLHRGRW